MGQVASAIANALDNSKEKEAQAKEQLELMMKLADARLDTFEAKLKTMFLDKDSSQKTSVPGKRALRFERHVSVDTETTVRIAFTYDYHVYGLLTFIYSLARVLKLLSMHFSVRLRQEVTECLMVSRMW